MAQLTVQEIVKAKLKVHPPSDNDIALATAESGQAMIDYCHLDAVPYDTTEPEYDPHYPDAPDMVKTIPGGLRFVWANLTIAVLALNTEQNNAADPAAVTQEISSVKEGDTQVNYASAKTATQANFAMYANTIILDYKGQLQEYRKVRW